MQNANPKPTAEISINTSFSSVMSGPESSTRRQRIAMACQYCRHRKIKCCGSTPCANCTRARRTCDYTPVPEEVNRATREKKAAAKAAKSAYAAQRSAAYFVDQSVYSMPYLAGPGPIRGTHVPPRRSYSTPIALSPYSPIPPAPAMTSPAQFEQPWFQAPPVPVISVSPMVPVMTTTPMTEATPTVDDGSGYPAYATAPVSPTESSTSTSYAMPMTPVRKPIVNTPPHTPSTAYFQQTPNLLTYTPQPFPFSPSPLAQSTFQTSPTLCPGLPVQHKQGGHPQHHHHQHQQPLVGLGIGITGAEEGVNYAAGVSNDYLSVSSAWTHTHPDHTATYI